MKPATALELDRLAAADAVRRQQLELELATLAASHDDPRR